MKHLSQATRAIPIAARLCAALLLALGTLGAPVRVAVQAQDPADPVRERLARMTTEEKVGQLFIVAFWGRNPSPPSRAGRLIQQYKIGGVVLSTENLNLVNQGPETPPAVARLNNTLQGMALAQAGPGIPLFVAIEHEGDGFPYTQVTSGTTPLPSPMAVGATWDTRYAEQVGSIAGQELAAMGINMLFGPLIDVLADPRPGSRGDIGTRAFGGDPYWVGEMGRAYIRGVHTASGGKVLTVAKHFPGHGGSDRLPDDEVATVDKSLQELRRVELAPFFAVANPRDPGGLDRTDAMMSSHIRYRGFYGDIRQFTRPISFDAEGMEALLDQPEFREWRRDGLMVSDSLGVRAVRKYFDPQLRSFPHRQIAREAFLAGNDLLVLSEFALQPIWEQQYDNIVQVIEYFRETYDRDAAFAARVDGAVERILRLKYRLYPHFTEEQVLANLQALEEVGTSQGLAVVDGIARQSATVLYPTVDSLPAPPRRDQDILIFSEERPVQECFQDLPECAPHPLLAPTSVKQSILRLYGPQGTDQVDPARITTRTYAQLKAFLTQREGDVGGLLEGAEWIVFGMLDPNPSYAASDALQLFLAQNAHQIYSADVVALAYTAPYYLDATEISKLSAYYVFYGRTQPAVETSVRTLFGEVRPLGSSPVSIAGTYYDLDTRLAPDPMQRITLELLSPTTPSDVVPATLRIRTRPIRDRNGNPVPDGTRVDVIARDADFNQILDTATALTVNGIAEAQLTITQPGRVAIVAQSGETSEGTPLYFEALEKPTPTLAPPTSTPTRALTPTSTPSPTVTPIKTTVPAPTVVPTLAPTPTAQPSTVLGILDGWHARPVDLLVATAAMLLVALGGYIWHRRQPTPRRVRVLLAAWIGGLLGYVAHGWQWIPLEAWLNLPSWLSSGLLALIGALLALILASLLP